MSTAADRRVRFPLVFLLVLCLTSTAMMTPWVSARHDSSFDATPVLFISAIPSGAATILAARTRSRLADGLDDLLKAVMITGRSPIVFALKSSLSFFESGACVAGLIDRTVVPVRAPPLSLFLQS